MLIQVLDFLMRNPYFWGVSSIAMIVISILGINRRNKKKLFYTTESNYLFGKKHSSIDNLTVTYANEPVDSLSVSKIAIVNNGTMTITTADIAKADPLKVSITNSFQILSASILKESNPSNLFTVTVDNKESVSIDFDFVNKRDGVVLQIVHTGGRDSLKFSGQIKGGTILNLNKSDEIQKSRALSKSVTKFIKRFFPEITFALFSFLFLLMITMVVLVIIKKPVSAFLVYPLEMKKENMTTFWAEMITLLVTYTFMWIYLLRTLIKRRYILPKTLREFFIES